MDGAGGGALLAPPAAALSAINAFNGDEGTPAYEWLRTLSGIADLYQWSEDTRLTVARLRCTGAASLWLDSKEFLSWDDFHSQFLDRFGEDMETLLTRFEQCIQRRGEPTRAYRDRFLALAVRAGRREDRLLPTRFFRGLNRALRRQLVPYKPTLHTIDQVVQAAQAIEEWEAPPSALEDSNVRSNAQQPAPYNNGSRPAFQDRTQRSEPRPFSRFPFNPRNRDQGDRRPAHNNQGRGQSQGYPASNQQGGQRSGDRRPLAPRNVQPTATTAGVDDITRKFGELAINYRDEISSLRREINRLRNGVQPMVAAFDQVNVMDWDYNERKGPPAEVLMKRPAEDGFRNRAPHKRVAFDPATTNRPAPHAPGPTPPRPAGGPAPPRRPPTPHTATRLPPNRTPFNPHGPPPGQPINPSVPQPRGTYTPPTAATPSTTLFAVTPESLADQKGKELALRACKDIKVDGVKESNICMPAVFACAAGHLIGGKNGEMLVDRGKDIARRVGSYMQRLATTPLPPIQTDQVSLAEPSDERNMNTITYSEAGKYTVCRASVNVGGQDMLAVIDTGASRSVLTLNAAEALGFTAQIDPTPLTYYNANGQLSVSPGQIKGLPITIGTNTVYVDAALTPAENYDLLIGNDGLRPAEAVLDYGQLIIYLPAADGGMCEVPMFIGGPEEEHNIQILTTTHPPSATNQPTAPTTTHQPPATTQQPTILPAHPTPHITPSEYRKKQKTGAFRRSPTPFHAPSSPRIRARKVPCVSLSPKILVDEGVTLALGYNVDPDSGAVRATFQLKDDPGTATNMGELEEAIPSYKFHRQQYPHISCCSDTDRAVMDAGDAELQSGAFRHAIQGEILHHALLTAHIPPFRSSEIMRSNGDMFTVRDRTIEPGYGVDHMPLVTRGELLYFFAMNEVGAIAPWEKGLHILPRFCDEIRYAADRISEPQDSPAADPSGECLMEDGGRALLMGSTAVLNSHECMLSFQGDTGSQMVACVTSSIPATAPSHTFNKLDDLRYHTTKLELQAARSCPPLIPSTPPTPLNHHAALLTPASPTPLNPLADPLPGSPDSPPRRSSSADTGAAVCPEKVDLTGDSTDEETSDGGRTPPSSPRVAPAAAPAAAAVSGEGAVCHEPYHPCYTALSPAPAAAAAAVRAALAELPGVTLNEITVTEVPIQPASPAAARQPASPVAAVATGVAGDKLAAVKAAAVAAAAAAAAAAETAAACASDVADAAAEVAEVAAAAAAHMEGAAAEALDAAEAAGEAAADVAAATAEATAAVAPPVAPAPSAADYLHGAPWRRASDADKDRWAEIMADPSKCLLKGTYFWGGKGAVTRQQALGNAADLAGRLFAFINCLVSEPGDDRLASPLGKTSVSDFESHTVHDSRPVADCTRQTCPDQNPDQTPDQIISDGNASPLAAALPESDRATSCLITMPSPMSCHDQQNNHITSTLDVQVDHNTTRSDSTTDTNTTQADMKVLHDFLQDINQFVTNLPPITTPGHDGVPQERVSPTATPTSDPGASPALTSTSLPSKGGLTTSPAATPTPPFRSPASCAITTALKAPAVCMGTGVVVGLYEEILTCSARAHPSGSYPHDGKSLPNDGAVVQTFSPLDEPDRPLESIIRTSPNKACEAHTSERLEPDDGSPLSSKGVLSSKATYHTIPKELALDGAACALLSNKGENTTSAIEAEGDDGLGSKPVPLPPGTIRGDEAAVQYAPTLEEIASAHVWDINELTKQAIEANDIGSFVSHAARIALHATLLTSDAHSGTPLVEADYKIPRDALINISSQDGCLDQEVESLNVGKELKLGQRILVQHLLSNYRDVFAFNPSEVGRTNLIRHYIDTGDAAPIKRGYIRMGKPFVDRLKKVIDEQLRLGFIRPSKSPWSSAALLVPKKNGDDRLVTDFRGLNSVTKKDRFPLPQIEDLLNSLGKANWFSALDAFSGYFQVELEESSKEKTAFITPMGLYEYNVMAQGLCNGPSSYSRLMAHVLRKHIGRCVYVYLDDLIIFSPTFEQHLIDIQTILQCLREANIKLAPSKCRMFQTSVCVLGHVCDARGTRPDPRLIQSIRDFSRPNNVKQVERWCGLVGFYRRFTKDHAKIIAPLNELRKKDVPWVWGDEQELSFQTLKSALINAPILARPDFDKEFTVTCDASQIAVGAILSQKDDQGRDHPIGYYSKKLSPAERRYSASELECFAVLTAVRHWRPYLLGKPFLVYTDHRALVWLMKTTNFTGRLARWALALQEFDFKIEYRKGKDNAAADALSRPNDEEEGDEPQQPDNQVRSFEDDAETLWVVGEQPRSSCQPADTILMVGSTTAEAPAESADATAGATGSNSLPRTPPSTLFGAALDAWLEAANVEEAGVPRLETPGEEPGLLLPNPYEQLPIVVSLEGNIGSGKSSALERLTGTLRGNWSLVKEPVNKWQPLLDVFYRSQATGASRDMQQLATAQLQMAVLHSYANLGSLDSQRVVMERGPWASLCVFLQAQNLHPYYKQLVYDAARASQLHLQRTFPSGIIYIDTPPEVCMERIRTRGRANEATVSLGYLKTLASKYEAALALFPGRKVRIDGTLPIETLALEVQKAVQELSELPRPTYTVFIPRDQESHPRAEPELFARTSTMQYWPPHTYMHMLAFEALAGVTLSADPIPYPPRDTNLFVPILFQWGIGRFKYSKDFARLYTAWNGQAPSEDYPARFDSWPAARVFCALGSAASSGPGANIRLALVPRRAAPGIFLYTDSRTGAEHVGIDIPRYVETRITERERDLVPPTDPERREAWEQDRILARQEMSAGYTDEAIRMLQQIAILPGDQHLQANDSIMMVSEDSGPSIDPNLKCVMCLSPDDDAEMVLCSHCTRGFHTYCVALSCVPEGEWYCNRCRRSGKYKATAPRAASPDTQPEDGTNEKENDNTEKQLGVDEEELLCTEHSPLEEGPGYKDPGHHGEEKDVESEHENVDDEGQHADSEAEESEDEGTPAQVPDIYDDNNVLHFVRTQRIDDEISRREAKRIKRRAQSYVWRDGQVYMLPTKKHKVERLVPPKDQRERIIDELHADLGHLGVSKMCNLIAKKYYWRRMTHQVKDKLRTCDSCQKRNATFKREAPELRPLPIQGPGHRISMDYAGPYPKTRKGNRYIILGVDSYTRWPEARAVKQKTADATTQFFVDEYIGRGNTPKVVHTDQGTEFAGEFSECLNSNGIEHNRSSAYRPASNGAAEAVVKNILHALQRTVGEHPESWDQHLPFVLLGQRSAQHTSTGFSPAFITYGREAILPLDRRLAAALADPTRRGNAGSAEGGEGPVKVKIEKHEQVTLLSASPTTKPNPSITTPAAQPSAPVVVVKQDPDKDASTTPALARIKTDPDASGAGPSSPPQGMTTNEKIIIELLDSSGEELTLPAIKVKIEGEQRPQASAPMEVIELLDSSEDTGTPPTKKVKTEVEERQKARDDAIPQAESNMKAAQEKQRLDYRRRRGLKLPCDDMPAGSMVLMQSPASTRGTKMQVGAEGPYMLVKWNGASDWAVIKDASGKEWGVHSTRISPYKAKMENAD